ncbi:hypothetical protein B0H16DRAFT_1702792 [Mycena metata]|uniref:Uncharacterized protein n=1 Tax=Mycena metata TaxID=1033252 RepID=A0AAD7H519_9AGAR|nr:hypothetical protein B0H16DRAFT_1702792 [Mycena metata]
MAFWPEAKARTSLGSNYIMASGIPYVGSRCGIKQFMHKFGKIWNLSLSQPSRLDINIMGSILLSGEVSLKFKMRTARHSPDLRSARPSRWSTRSSTSFQQEFTGRGIRSSCNVHIHTPVDTKYNIRVTDTVNTKNNGEQKERRREREREGGRMEKMVARTNADLGTCGTRVKVEPSRNSRNSREQSGRTKQLTERTVLKTLRSKRLKEVEFRTETTVLED